MTTDTNTLSYWLNWRFFLCALFIFFTMGLASFLIWKYEEFNKSRNERVEEGRRETVGLLYEDEAWNTCLKGIHPNWLLAYRIISFLVLLGLLIANVAVDGGGIFFFYTQWTFTLVTIYFALASCFSLNKTCFNHKKFEGNTSDAERGTYVAPTLDGISDIPTLSKRSYSYRESLSQNTAGIWGYTIQILFQTCAGASVLTDLVFWLVLYPFVTPKDFRLDIFTVGMHSVNAVLLLGETSLNCMSFPVFRFAYFILWTVTFVIFQWIIHAAVSLWWPYPFLDLSSPYAPLWYLAVGIMHIPCYSVFALIVKLKHLWLSKLCPGACQFLR
ncbi:uncharacterized protein LOC123906896 [Trifolium pratense]|uniref:Uncharacterized protein n=1 Tax=Trifolium pratense TaxID=57577 RepID=A0ACB0JT93_TRIPR|nr:uncharacterized protein LOC123906896 [Trifolium pratense]CAJ2647526.1 unnamed protein product [Trifolium pratense]